MSRNALRSMAALLFFALVIRYGFKGEKNARLEASELSALDRQIQRNAQRMIEAGRQIFRFDTFGDEAFWGDTLNLHQAIATVSPKTALAVGLKVDSNALPPQLIANLKEGRVNLDDPATTISLLQLNSVVGVTGFFNEQGGLRSIGIQCAFCHSTVDNSLAPGIGRRLDGWANRDLNVGAIIALAPNVKPLTDLLKLADPTIDDAKVRAVLRSWGPGKFDAQLVLDGKASNPNTGMSAATLIPPAFGLAGVNLATWTGWGSVTHWNAFVANLEMHGKGTFFDPRLNDPLQFPVAANAGFSNVRNDTDLISSKLAALHFYQLAIPAPKPPEGSFDKAAAQRGKITFNGKANCASCHVPPLFTEPGWNLHTAAEIGIDDFQANRAPDKRYRTAPLNGLWAHTTGGFFHDGRFATLLDVVNHYNGPPFNLNMNSQEKNDLIEYLKSLPEEEN